MPSTVETLEIKGIEYAVEILPGRSVALHRGSKTYVVSQGETRTTCDCPDWLHRHAHLEGTVSCCKHIAAVVAAGLLGLAHDADDAPTVAPVKAEAPAFKLSRPDHQFKLGLTDAPKAPASLAERYRPRVLRDMVGQGLATFRLESFLEAPYSTAFLFDGPTGVGKTTAALAIAAELGAVEFGGLDIIKSGMQDAEAVESALNSLRFTPMLGSGWKVVIVDEADYMSPKASQVWLSALEDLPARSVIIFTTNNPGKFPDRFVDRCERISFEADATIHSQDAQALIDWIWHEEVGGGNGPDFATLPNVVDKGGHLSYRRVIRALEPLIARGKAETPAPAPVVEPAPEPEPAPVATEPPIESQASESIDLAAEFKAGVTIAELARKLGVSTTTVRRRLEKAGIALPKRSAKAETVIVEPIAVEPTPEPEPVATLASEAPAVPCNPLFGTDPEYTLIITIAPHFEPWGLSVLDCHPAGIVDDSTCDVYLVVEPYPADLTPEPEPTTETNDVNEPTPEVSLEANFYRAYKAARVERFRQYAANAASRAHAAQSGADRILSFIPPGQPILIGHHSEKRHRRDLRRADNCTRKSCDEQRKSEYWERRAAAAESNRAISSRDPEALTLLRARIALLESRHAEMRGIQAAHRRYLKDPASIEQSGLSESLKTLVRSYQPAYSWEPHPIAPYQLTNSSANIRRLKGRLADLERRAAGSPA